MSDHLFWLGSLLLLALVSFLRYLYLQKKHEAKETARARFIKPMADERLQHEYSVALFEDLLSTIETDNQPHNDRRIIEFQGEVDEKVVADAVSLLRVYGCNAEFLPPRQVAYWPVG